MDPRRPFFVVQLALVSAGLAACTGPAPKTADSGGSAAPTWHADVNPIVQSRCVSCHQDGEIGPFALTTYAEAAPLAEAIAGSVESRTMPPWGAEPGHREYLHDPSLTDDQVALVRAWADAGAPEGDPAAPGAALPDVTSGEITADLTLRSEAPYTVQGDPDDYRCFVLEWPEIESSQWVTGFTTELDNRQVVHHIAAYLFRPDNLMGEAVFDQLRTWEDADDTPGYECYGGPSGDTSSQIPAIQLAQWVPGMGGLQLPAGSGIEVPPGSMVVLQMHYFDPTSEPQVDQTGLSLQLADSVERRGAFAPWLSGVWAAGGMVVPAGEAEVVHTEEGDPRGFFEFLVAGLDMSGGFDVPSALFHMHKLGKRGELAVTHADGEEEVVLVVDPWDFDWQRVYQLAEPIEFRDGDSLRVSCTFDNSADNPEAGGSPQEVTWGEGTNDEMCVGNLFITEP